MTFQCNEIHDDVRVDESVDLHGHLRNNRGDGDGRMEMNVRHAVGHHGVLVHIGNGTPAILDQESADAELKKANACLEEGETLQFYAAPLMTDRTTEEMVRATRLREPRTVLFWKAFLSGVSNDGGNSVSNFQKVSRTLYALYDPAVRAPVLPLHVHTERKYARSGQRIPMPDREWYAVRHDIGMLLKWHPEIEVVLKHVSDMRTLRQVAKWREQGFNVYAEVCPHYLYRCHDDLYEGPGGGTAFNLNDLCWPIYKDEASMQALREAVLAGTDWIMFGSDWACHKDDPQREQGVKVNADGIVVGGVAILPAVAKSLIIDLFVEAGKLEHLDAYLSGNARRVHHLPPSQKKVRYVREPWKVPNLVESDGLNGLVRVRPFMRGQLCNWQLAP